MQPAAKNKLVSFLHQRGEGPPEINPHGLNSPPRQIAAASASSQSSPLGPKHDKQKLIDSMKLPMGFAKPARNSNGVMKPPGTTPRIKRQPSEGRNGWESAPPAPLNFQENHDENEKGLRERWEEQSNIQSLFSESAPTIPAAMEQDDGNLDEDSTRSDTLDNRQRPRRGRLSHSSTERVSSIDRNRDQQKSSERRPLFAVGKNSNFIGGGIDPKKFNSSMITHAPRSSMPEPAVFRQDPFGSTSGGTSPLPERGGAFLHSSFPYRGSDAAKGLSHVERAAFHQEAAKKLSPEKYDGMTDAIHPQTFAKSVRITSISDQRPAVVQSVEAPHLMDSYADDSDGLSQEDGLDAHHPSNKAPNQKIAQQDATVVFNPQQPLVPQRSQRSVVLQPEPLQVSPMSRFIGQQSPAKKRRRDIDYDDTALQRMDFQQLQNEPFDHDPTKEVPQSPAKPPGDNLSDRLKFYGGKDEDSQAQLFTQMAVRDWEDSGDWFLEQFGDVVRKMKEARQAKRRMVEQFEREVSNREEAVRHKKESIDRKLSKLKNDSFAMMKDKGLDE
ncbi:hypothetical protein N0V93_007158 [Gnomoniopsis smithogilvyi]|uniref:Extracellular mutant protein 11 C-terminal domain-containing protein n=1 Tax=Gnomoniopsis smithogilvyi TaxID=1191159 RepID=A0A9W8YR36_9PEZI|nr:hypothetical protein N0V93_007158 [Gnomoniopsis smithogilvyi]